MKIVKIEKNRKKEKIIMGLKPGISLKKLESIQGGYGAIFIPHNQVMKQC
ncbi:hypothetical protein CWATWH0402_3 [Crocosphaera watsonii WH 0402]|uniref:Uncharacterized protein n=1 Tax=Crocosphaera watsonii WH 0402 TaxID=1284629 RepID=T2JSL3_CROWT|nr:hypothetical protein CWATWH0402_3 [Crocosphaera watsonii WH 0402]